MLFVLFVIHMPSLYTSNTNNLVIYTTNIFSESMVTLFMVYFEGDGLVLRTCLLFQGHKYMLHIFIF